LLILSTINRTNESYLKAIIGAEYILGWLEKGTHDWHKFITPDEMQQLFTKNDLKLQSLRGMNLCPLTQTWSLSNHTGVNYICSYRQKRS
jgi:2-polyprenyl-6-hydroxyphenyl methylase/3-demethylubiquinone-9 3-methyltransferase